MSMVFATSPRARTALRMVEGLQAQFRDALLGLPGGVAGAPPAATTFTPTTWLRDAGRHGGGVRFGAEGARFNRASLNTSQVHYDDDPQRPLGSASALSCIVHPAHPLSPSLHLHISWTEQKSGEGYWRVMADLNPSHPDAADRERFLAALRAAAGPLFPAAAAQGDRYFHIPALARHRGVAHFYLEQFATADAAQDLAFAEGFGRAAIAAYASILAAHAGDPPPTAAERQKQLEYHTVYLFQVLTLDRGTTSGLLVHDQNDAGILGSLPARVDRALLASWEPKLPKPQDELLRALAATLPADGAVEDATKVALCRVVRAHYQAHPEALELQARGDVLPPTVANHR